MGQECCVAIDPSALEQNSRIDDVKLQEKVQSLPQLVRDEAIAQAVDIKLAEVEEKLVEQERKEEEWLKHEEEAIQKEEEAKQQYVDLHALIHLYQKCVHHYKGDDIDSATDVGRQIEAAKAAIKEKRGLDEEKFISLLRSVEQAWQKSNPGHKIQPYSHAFIKVIQEEMKEVLHYFDAVYKQPFVEKSNEDGVKISTRKQANTIGAMIQCQLHVPFEHFASILTEVDYFDDFLPFCEKSNLVKDIARNNKVGYVVLNLPFVARREAYFQGCAYFRFKKCKDIFIYTRSIHDKPELQQLCGVETPLNKDYVPLDYKYFVINYEPLREGVGNLKFAFNIDNGVHFLPQFIQDYVTREFGKKFFKNILRICKNFKGSKWQKKMMEKPEFSMFLKEKIKEQLGHLRQEEQSKK